MSFKKRNAKKRKDLRKRHNQRMKNREASGGKKEGRYPTIFKKDAIPDGVEFFRPKEGSHIVDIIQFEAGPDMPVDTDMQPVTEEGELDYILELAVHQNIGSMKKPYVCPYENFGKPCPICEYMKDHRLEKSDWNDIRAKDRVIYLVWVHNTREEEKKGIQIFEVARFFMEQNLEEIAKLPRGGGYLDFADYEDGKSIAWKRTGSSGTDTKYLGHRFVDRENSIPDRILDASFPLDSIVNMHPSYKEMEKAFRGNISQIEGSEESEESEEDWGNDSPETSKKRKPKKRKSDSSETPKKKKTKKRKRKRKV